MNCNEHIVYWEFGDGTCNKHRNIHVIISWTLANLVQSLTTSPALHFQRSEEMVFLMGQIVSEIQYWRDLKTKWKRIQCTPQFKKRKLDSVKIIGVGGLDVLASKFQAFEKVTTNISFSFSSHITNSSKDSYFGRTMWQFIQAEM